MGPQLLAQCWVSDCKNMEGIGNRKAKFISNFEVGHAGIGEHQAWKFIIAMPHSGRIAAEQACYIYVKPASYSLPVGCRQPRTTG